MGEKLPSDQVPFWTTGEVQGYYGQLGEHEEVKSFGESRGVEPSGNSDDENLTSID